MQNIDSDLIRGNIDTIILKTMLNEDKYGLDIIKEVEQRSSGTYELKQPTLYSCLKRLENQELISSYWLNSDIGGRRHYYKLTDKGREFYNKKQEEWAKSKFVIDNLLSNYNYEEYRLVKKEDYDKAMNAVENAKTEEPFATEEVKENSSEFFSDNYDDDSAEEIEDQQDTDEKIDSIEETNENSGLSFEEEPDENAVSYSEDDEIFSDDELENDFDEDTNKLDEKVSNDDEYDFSMDDEDSEGFNSDENDFMAENYKSNDEDLDNDASDEVVYVSQEEIENKEDENHDSPSYDLPDQTQNESNILDMLRRQNKEEINTYEGDKKSYANQIKSIYDDVKYVQDDMIIEGKDENDDVDQKIKEFKDVASQLEEFENASQDDEESEDTESYENDELENEYQFEMNKSVSEADAEVYNDDSIESDEVDEYNIEENPLLVEENNLDEEDLNFEEDETKFEEDGSDDSEFNEEFDFSTSDDDAFTQEEPKELSEEYENTLANTSFFSNTENLDYQSTTQPFTKINVSNDEDYAPFETPENKNYTYDEDFKPSQFESYNSSKFNKDEYDSTFVNVKKDTENNFFDEKSLENSDIDSIISKNVSSQNQNLENNNNFFERRYVNENYKQKLSDLSIYSKATSEKTETSLEKDESSQADDMETLKINFEREGIKVKEYKKSNTYEVPEKTYLLSNKINLIKSLILLFGYAFVLSGMYIVLQNSLFGMVTEGFSFKYFFYGLIPFIVLTIYNLVIYIISPYKKVPARFASRIMIFLAVIVTVQLLLITYCVNLQLGFYSFTQAGYNHLLWIIPTTISFGPIISNLIYMALFYSGNFNV